MIVLLDTNVLLFAMDNEIGILTEPAKTALLNAEKALVSAVSFYEIAQLVRLGRIEMTRKGVEEIEDFCAQAKIEVVPISATHYRKAAFMTWDNRDPFDRIVIAVASLAGASLLTSDRKIAALAAMDPAVPRVIW